MRAESPQFGAVCASIRLDDPEVTKWLAFAIAELERNAPRDALQLPAVVQRTFAMVKAFARRDAVASVRAFARVENSVTPVESDATVVTMTTAEVRDELGLTSTQRVTQLRKAGRLVGVKHGHQWRIERQSVAAEQARRAAR
jgi:hypothetical protein